MNNLFSESSSIGKLLRDGLTNFWNGGIEKNEPAPVAEPSFFGPYRAIVEDYLKHVTNKLSEMPAKLLLWTLFGLCVVTGIAIAVIRIIRKSYQKSPNTRADSSEAKPQEIGAHDQMPSVSPDQNSQSQNDCAEEIVDDNMPGSERFELIVSPACLGSHNSRCRQSDPLAAENSRRNRSPSPIATQNCRFSRSPFRRQRKEDEYSPNDVDNPSQQPKSGRASRPPSRIPVSVARFSSPKPSRSPKED